jgi:hypothetical protein
MLALSCRIYGTITKPTEVNSLQFNSTLPQNFHLSSPTFHRYMVLGILPQDLGAHMIHRTCGEKYEYQFVKTQAQ